MLCHGYDQVKRKRKVLDQRCKERCTFFYCRKHWKVYFGRKRVRVNSALTLFTLVVGSAFYLIQIKGCLTSAHTEFINLRYITGIMAPYLPGSKIRISEGGVTEFSAPIEGNEFQFGQTIFIGCFDKSNKNDEAFNYTIRIVDNVFLISIRLYDFKTKDPIVDITENSYSIDRLGINDYFTDKTFFSDPHAIEIKDRHDQIAFCMWIDENNVLQLRGYFVGATCTIFANGGAVEMISSTDPNYENKCRELASKLKPKFIGQTTGSKRTI